MGGRRKKRSSQVQVAGHQEIEDGIRSATTVAKEDTSRRTAPRRERRERRDCVTSVKVRGISSRTAQVEQEEKEVKVELPEGAEEPAGVVVDADAEEVADVEADEVEVAEAEVGRGVLNATGLDIVQKCADRSNNVRSVRGTGILQRIAALSVSTVEHRDTTVPPAPSKGTPRR